MKPIVVLNRFGETLIFDTSLAASNDDPRLKYAGLLHGACRSPVSVRKVSPTHNGIFCPHCGRIPDPAYVPQKIGTCDELRQWCEHEIAEKKEWEKRISIVWGLVPIKTKSRILAAIAEQEAAEKAGAVNSAKQGFGSSAPPLSGELDVDTADDKVDFPLGMGESL